MKKIGVLHGVENTFPGALVDRINGMGVDGVVAEIAKVDAVRMGEPSGYAVLVDRISHDLPFYRSYLKNAALTGTEVINNPFWWSADDKFFNYALAQKLGVAVPRTVLLPHKNYPPQINTDSLRNLNYPLDWGRVFEYVGFPAFLKPHDGGGWRDVYHVHSEQDFFRAYDLTRDLAMVLQAAVNFEEYFRCYVVGRREVRIMAYDPRRPHDQRYIQDGPEYDPALLERVEQDALRLCQALGYDLNTVEFAVEGGVPYAIDFMNPAPDADFYSVGQENFNWIVNAVARLAVERAQRGKPEVQGELRCMQLLNEGRLPGVAAGAAAPKKASGAKAGSAKIASNGSSSKKTEAAVKAKAAPAGKDVAGSKAGSGLKAGPGAEAASGTRAALGTKAVSAVKAKAPATAAGVSQSAKAAGKPGGGKTKG